jgi:RNA polymerase sigma factor (sigma-70 family)
MTSLDVPVLDDGRPAADRRLGPGYSPRVSSARARPEDDEVEAAFVAGAGDGLRRTYDAYGRLVFTLCRRSLGPEAAADITQEVFVSAWQARHQFDPGRGSLAGWLVGIARNKVIDALRAQARRPTSAREPLQTDAPVTVTALDSLADRLLLADAMDELPDRAKKVIQLAFFEDLSHPEIAERTSLPLGTVKSDIRRGLQRMRRHLEREP